jgi:uncharacterized membrane protein YeiH
VALLTTAVVDHPVGQLLAAITDVPLSLPTWTPLFAVVVGAVAGAAYAARRGSDVVGVLLLAFVQGMGGLLLRDTLLQTGTPTVLLESRYLVGASLAAAAGFLFAGLLTRLAGTLLVLDALALGILCTLGAGAALALTLSSTAAVFIGVVTAAGGPVLRDVVAGESPLMLRPGVFTAVAALIGTSLFVVLVTVVEMSYGPAQLITVMVVLVVRVLAIQLGWQTTAARDLSDRVWRLWSRRPSEQVAERLPRDRDQRR